MRDYNGQKIFIGIDVHKKTYALTAVMGQQIVKKDTIAASPEMLIAYIKKHFRRADVYSAYEAGFCGFSLHRLLNTEGVKNTVVHPASIEIASRERVKTDKRDSQKIAVQLAAGRLKAVHVPEIKREDFRLITRYRETLVREKNRKANQIKSFLYQIGKMPTGDVPKTSKKWLESILSLELSHEQRFCLEHLIKQWLELASRIEETNRKFFEQAERDSWLEAIYRSVPGIGPTAARVLANELGDMSHFPNERTLFSYTGLTPREHSSGEHRRLGHISRQGKPILRKTLVQSAWRAIKCDKDLGEIYKRISEKSGAKRAIIAVARRLVGRIRACIKKGCAYRSDKEEGFNDRVKTSYDCELAEHV